MAKSTFKTGSSAGGRRDLQFPTARQGLRQLGVIALVVAVWSALLVGTINLTGQAAEQPLSQAAAPTQAPTATAPAAAPSLPTETPPQATQAPSDEETAPTATEPPAEAPTATPPPTPTETPLPEPTEPPPAPESGVSFAADVLPIFESRCVQCHGPSRTSGGLQLDSYQAATAASESGSSILPGDAAHSLLVELIVSGEMPRRGPRLTPAEIQAITDWVNAGAPDN